MLYVILSTGHTVQLRGVYTHRMENAFKEALTRGMTLKDEGGKVVVGDIKADALDRAAEAVLPLLVEKIVNDGQDVPFTPDWLLDLPEKDFARLKAAITKLREESEAEAGRGKKSR